jgi:uncharacterized membrane protein YidH (DUF202 family)
MIGQSNDLQGQDLTEDSLKKLVKQEKKKAKLEKEAVKMEYTLEKLRISFERLQFVWIKFNVTCIAIGFGLYKFYVAKNEGEYQTPVHQITGRDLGITLVSLGLLMLCFATYQHTKNIAKLKLQYPEMQRSLALVLSYCIIALSTLILLIVIYRA